MVVGTIITIPSCYAATIDAASVVDERASPWIGVVKASDARHRKLDVPSYLVSFETTEGTFMSVDVSPDGQTLVFDLLGDVYQLPIEGGIATPLTTGTAWDQAPRVSPDGAHVYFISDREGHKNLWRLKLVNQSLRQITRSGTDILGGPNWSQDGRHLLVGVVSADRMTPDVILHSVDPTSGAMTPVNLPSVPWVDPQTRKRLRSLTKTYSGVATADGRLFFSETLSVDSRNRKYVRLYEFDQELKVRNAITPTDAEFHDYKPQLSHNGKVLAYFRQYSDRRTELRILNLATNHDEMIAALVDVDDAEYTQKDDSGPNYAFTPDGKFVLFWHSGKIHRARIADGSMKIVPFRVSVGREILTRVLPTAKQISDVGEATTIRWPTLSRDGQTMAFSAFGYVWAMDVQNGDVRRINDYISQ